MIENIEKKRTILSHKYENFAKNDNIPARINPKDESVHRVFNNYIYPVTAWPVIVDKVMSGQLMELSLTIPKLLKKITSLYFNNDIKKIADFYFDGDMMQAEFAMMSHNKDLEIGCRLDLTYSDEGFKVLEANIGSSLGGWQVLSFEKAIRKNHDELIDESKLSYYKARNTVKIYMDFLVKQMLKNSNLKTETLNLYIYMMDVEEGNEEHHDLEFFNVFFKQTLKEYGLDGEALTSNINSLELKEGNLYLNEKIINGVIVLAMNVNPTPDIFRAFMMDKIYFPDHLGLSLLSDKRNLGILSELAQEGKFLPLENDLVIKHIPWTSFVEDKHIFFKGKKINLLELLSANKNNFVIKAARGFQGKDVFVGKFLEDYEWEEAIQVALETRTFIAQEFCDSVSFLAPNEQKEWTPHRLIWGAFGFGDDYGGVWVRMSEVESNAAVINSATGAVEAIVFEIPD